MFKQCLCRIVCPALQVLIVLEMESTAPRLVLLDTIVHLELKFQLNILVQEELTALQLDCST